MLMQLRVLHKLLLGDLGLMPHVSLIAVVVFWANKFYSFHVQI